MSTKRQNSERSNLTDCKDTNLKMFLCLRLWIKRLLTLKLLSTWSYSTLRESRQYCFSCITYPSEHGTRQLILLYVNNVGLSLCNVDVPMDLVARHVGHSLNYHLTFRFRHSFVDWPQERCTNQTTLLLRYFHSVQGPTARRLCPLFPNIISLD